MRPGEILALTGVSGAGKSSLALDTLYAEGQRRFVESFSPYARQFLERLERPPMDRLAPVAAGVAVDRRGQLKSSRSTVATMADLEAYLAGLFSKESVPHCPEHGQPATRVDLTVATGRVQQRFDGQRVLISYRAQYLDEDEYLRLHEQLKRDGYRRLVCGGQLFELDQLRPSVALDHGCIYVVLDRLKVGKANAARMSEALDVAFSKSQGMLTPGQAFVFAESLSGQPQQIRAGLTCPTCARELLAPKPGYFSYESPLGACDNCRGFGRVMGVDLDKVIPDDRLSLAAGAIRPFRGEKTAWERRTLESFCEQEGIDFHAPFSSLGAAEKQKILEGSKKKGRRAYPGVLPWFEWLKGKAYKMHVRVFLARYRAYDPCPVCNGSRLNDQSLWYRWGGLNLAEWHRLEIDEVVRRLESLSCETPHGRLLLREFSSRLAYLKNVGLGYLTLERQARTLSGGEAQRVTLTAALGSSLHNALFVVDEPSVGLHPTDIFPLCEALRKLAQRDNAVIVVEHDPLLIRAADRVVELGPGAGEQGGQVVFDGTPAAAARQKTATRRALAAPSLAARVHPNSTGELQIEKADCNNLKRLSVAIPLGQVVAVSGPSGSGKSTLVEAVVYRSAARQVGQVDVPRPGRVEKIAGLQQLEHVLLVDQSPLGRTSRGNAATYTKAWDTVRKLFAAEPQAQAAGYSASHFSFNVAGGRCESCAGEGSETVEMQFLADVALVCPACSGRRFRDEVLSVTHRGKSIFDVLQLTVQGALSFFEGNAPIRRALAPLRALGLGYVRLGQPLSTLSGGEAQRLKLARALASPQAKTLYVLDEPSAGLHADEVELLIEALRVLVQSGGSVLFVDHDLSLIAAADWVIELGPGGGERGGQLVFSGTPAQLLGAKTRTASAFQKAERVVRASKGAGQRIQRNRSALSVRGASEHSLKHLDVDIPLQKLTVVTGPSGSGKSSLAFDVVFAEGQRRFMETLTPYARRFLPTMPRPSVDVVDGVPPSVALEQRTTRTGARSTVATVTEAAHYLRLLFAKLGQAHCPVHEEAVSTHTAEELLSLIKKKKGRGDLCAPVVQGRKGSYLEVFDSAARANIPWAVADSCRVSTSSPPRLAKGKVHDIDLVLRQDVRLASLSESDLKSALRWGRGSVAVFADGTRELLSQDGACSACGFSVGEIDPRYFSFNTTQGQCSHCLGTGIEPEPARRGKKKSNAAPSRICLHCQGARLSPFSRKVRLGGWTYPTLTALSVAEARAVLRKLRFSGRRAQIAEPALKELLRRMDFLGEVGLDYLSLDRAASSLSGGEYQRLRLAAQLGSDLTGALYILDEPTIGLHPRDTGRLMKNLRQLVDSGSTVLMVEHDRDAIIAADYVIDLGPGGGTLGGQVTASGPPHQVLANLDCPTGAAFARPFAQREPQKITKTHPMLELRGARQHNLKGGTLRLPQRALTVVAGVSGSGKSTLIRQILLPALRQKLKAVTLDPGPHDELRGYESIKRAIAVDQSPIGRTPRSVPATFLGVFDIIRRLFAKTPEAQVRGFTPARFSFNTPSGGRCTTCEGQGALSHEMSFLPDVVTPCPACGGLRFEERTLEVRYLGKSIGEVLALSAEQAVELFAAHPKITAPLSVLRDLGAGYITLGQGSHTLSGGEAQRLKLACELSAGVKHEPTLYVLDEPTTGLHLADVEKLIEVLGRLVERGDTLVVIEHQPEVIKSADWVVELGPEGGPRGGKLVFQGPVQGLLQRKTATSLALSG